MFTSALESIRDLTCSGFLTEYMRRVLPCLPRKFMSAVKRVFPSLSITFIPADNDAKISARANIFFTAQNTSSQPHES